jgi:hypothetical protein
MSLSIDLRDLFPAKYLQHLLKHSASFLYNYRGTILKTKTQISFLQSLLSQDPYPPVPYIGQSHLDLPQVTQVHREMPPKTI